MPIFQCLFSHSRIFSHIFYSCHQFFSHPLPIFYLFFQGLESPSFLDNLTSDQKSSSSTRNFTNEKDKNDKIVVNNTRRDEMKSTVTHRTVSSKHLDEDVENDKITKEITKEQMMSSWKRILLLIIAITVHNIPGMKTFIFTIY